MTTGEDSISVAVLANDTDPDGETLTTASITQQPSQGLCTPGAAPTS